VTLLIGNAPTIGKHLFDQGYSLAAVIANEFGEAANDPIHRASLIAAGLVPPPPGVVPATRYTVSAVTQHLLTNAAVVKRFLPVEVSIAGREEEEGEVRVQPPGATAQIVPLSPPEA
jgi:RNA 3'-terminal phosphate cyclase